MAKPLWDAGLVKRAEEAYRLLVLVRKTDGNREFRTTAELRAWAEKYLKEPTDGADASQDAP